MVDAQTVEHERHDLLHHPVHIGESLTARPVLRAATDAACQKGTEKGASQDSRRHVPSSRAIAARRGSGCWWARSVMRSLYSSTSSTSPTSQAHIRALHLGLRSEVLGVWVGEEPARPGFDGAVVQRPLVVHVVDAHDDKRGTLASVDELARRLRPGWGGWL